MIDDAYDNIKHQIGSMELPIHQCKLKIKEIKQNQVAEPKRKTQSPVKSRYQKPPGYTGGIKSVTLNTLKKQQTKSKSPMRQIKTERKNVSPSRPKSPRLKRNLKEMIAQMKQPIKNAISCIPTKGAERRFFRQETDNSEKTKGQIWLQEMQKKNQIQGRRKRNQRKT